MLKHLRSNAACDRSRRCKRSRETRTLETLQSSPTSDTAVRWLWQCFGVEALNLVLTHMMVDRREIIVGRVVKQRKPTCCDAVWAALLRLELRCGRWEVYLYGVV